MKTTLLTFASAALLVIAFALLSSFTIGKKSTEPATRDNTPGTVTFTVKTLPAGGNYAPRHVLAIWVEHNGTFVKTRKAMANARKQYLYKWKAASNYNVVDAITGSTLTSHQTHTVTWDCTDLNGNIVIDGDYTMIIEFTDKHAQGPFYEIDFTKGTEPVVINPPDQTYIINMQLTYEPENIATADFSANVTEVCPEQTVTFTDNSTGATSWAWNFGAGASPATANTQGPHNVTYASSGNKTVSLTINSSVTQTQSDYITVYPISQAGFTFSQNDFMVDFTNTSANAVSYLWDFGDGETSTQTNPTHTYAQNGSYAVSLTATSEMCGDDIHTETIVIDVVISADFSADITEVCPDQQVTFTDNSTNATSWAWDFGDGAFPSTANTQGPHNVGYLTSGSKTVSLTINGSINQTQSDYITVYPVPEAGFSFTQNSFVVDFTNTSTNAISYYWDFDDGETSTEENPTHVYGQDGTYEVSLTATSEMCGDAVHAETIIINTVGISEVKVAETISVYPNPSNGEVFLSVEQVLQNVTVKVFDLHGKTLFNQSLSQLETGATKLSGLTELQSGIYFLEVQSDQVHFREKLLIK